MIFLGTDLLVESAQLGDEAALGTDHCDQGWQSISLRHPILMEEALESYFPWWDPTEIDAGNVDQ